MENGLDVEMSLIWKSVWLFGLALALGAGVAIIKYCKAREYPAKGADTVTKASQVSANELPNIEKKHWATIVVAIAIIVSQIQTSSLPLGTLVGIALLLLFRVAPWKDFEKICASGIKGFGSVAFILMATAGFAAVFRKYGQVHALIFMMSNLINGNQLIGTLMVLFLGLIITIGIGSGFAAIPIISTIIVPMCARMNFGEAEIILIITVSVALGDGVTPASSQTLLSTAVLNLDGEHDHIRDTCMPIFLCYVISSIMAVIIAISIK